MKAKRILSLALAVMMVLSVMTACGNLPFDLPFDMPLGGEKEPTENQLIPTDDAPVADSDEQTEATTEATVEATQDEEVPQAGLRYETMPDKLRLKKVATIQADYVSLEQGGVIYTAENELKGIATLDGKNDTGAIYTYCNEDEGYFIVADKLPTDATQISELNVVGLVDAYGEELIPQQYASIEVLNERFARACEVTEPAESKDGALVYYSNEAFSFMPDEDDTYFLGNWYIYDLTTGQKVPGATGTQPYYAFAYGNYVKFTTDDEKSHKVDAQGKALPEDASLFENGTYQVEDDEKGTVYDKDGDKLFTYDVDGYEPTGVEGNYFTASKYDSGNSTYVLLDAKGNVVTAEFPSWFTVYGRLILCDDKVYDFAGNQVVEGTVEGLRYDERFENIWIVKNGEERTLIDVEGTEIMHYTCDDSLYYEESSFAVAKRDSDGNRKQFYCLADGDYVLEGSYAVAPWLVQKTNEDWTEDLIDTVSGNALLEGYEGYGYGYSCDDFYIYAQTEDDAFEIYLVQ